MTYQEVIDRIFLLQPRYTRKAVVLSQSLSSACGNPHLAFPSIHIAGTNGKGSVALKMAKALQFSGLKVGLFTSPHLFSFTERMKVNGQAIPEDKVVVLGEQALALCSKLAPEASFFDLMTLMAFCYFRDEKVDIAVIEAGIGGRFDSTNILQPILTVITSIGEDHMPLLGTNLEQIAEEKAGIIKKNAPLVLGPHADYAVIRQEAQSMGVPVYVAERVDGFYDLENQSTARRALELLKAPQEMIEKGLAVRPSCRFEIAAPNWIFDVAHNPSGVERLLEALQVHFPDEPFSVIVNMSQDKDVKKCLQLFASKAQHIYLVEAPRPRSMSASKMAEILTSLNFKAYTEVGKRYDLILGIRERCVVAGTFYIMQEIRDVLRRAGQIP